MYVGGAGCFLRVFFQREVAGWDAFKSGMVR